MIEPYINLGGSAQEAIAFYDAVFHCKSKKIYRLCDMPENPDLPLTEEMRHLVGDSELEICGSIVHISDLMGDFMTRDGHISLMVHFDEAEALRETYKKLTDEGQVLMELAPQPFAREYAWVRDRFGVGWQLMYD